MLIREKRIPIANLDLYKPSQVVAMVNKSCSHYVSQNTHTDCWKHFQVRPLANSGVAPEKCKSDYCVYDDAHGDYVFTDAWVRKLVTCLSDPVKFEEITGRKPRAKK